MKKKKTLSPKWFKGKKVTVFGIGSLGGGVSVIKYLVAHGAQVIATDIKSKQHLQKSLAQLKGLKGVTYALGQHRQEDFTRVDMVIKTPSCPWHNKHIKLARAHNIPVETDASLFMQLCNNTIIGITGTKGKTTVSHMIAHLLKGSGYHPIHVGVGITPVLDRLDLLKKNSIVVFELSSWRLSGLTDAKVSPHIAVFTNLFPDHMNYYKSMDSYAKDKINIFRFQKKTDALVYNIDDDNVTELSKDAPGQKIPVSIEENHILDAKYFVDAGGAYVRETNTAEKLFNLDDLSLVGKHNSRNILLAFAAVASLGAQRAKLTKAVKTFQPIKHRLEFVRDIDGVAYYNDTAATNPNAAIAAIDSFQRPIILLAGGAEKNLPVEDFAQKILTDVKDVLFFKGEGSEKIIRAIKKHQPEKANDTFDIYASMEEALAAARTKAQKGDIVLLSPGASSFGMFKNEFDRGDTFRTLVQAL